MRARGDSGGVLTEAPGLQAVVGEEAGDIEGDAAGPLNLQNTLVRTNDPTLDAFLVWPWH
jgi:hypothetical protein